MIEAPASPERPAARPDAPSLSLDATVGRALPLPLRVAIGLALTSTGVALSWGFTELTGESLPVFALIFVAGAWWFGGVWVGLACTLLATAGISYLVYEPLYEHEVTRGELARLAGWAAGATFVGAMAHILRRRTRQLEGSLSTRQGLLNAALDAERRIDHERALFSTVIARAPIGIGVWDRDLRCLQINARLAEMNGLSAERTIGRRPDDYMPEHWPRWRPYFEAALRGEASLDVEMEGQNLREEYAAVLASYYPVRIGDEVLGVALVCSDVTEQRRAMRALEASEQRYRALTETTDAMVFTADASGGQITLQSMGETARRDAAFWATNWTTAFHPDDRERVVALWQEAVAQARPFSAIGRIRPAAGDVYRWYEARAVPVRDARGAVREWVGTVTDIDDRQRAAQELRMLARLSETFARSLSVDEIAAAVAESVVPAFCDGAGAYIRADDGSIRPVHLAHGEHDTRPVEGFGLRADAAHGPAAVLRTGAAEFYPHVPQELLRESAGSEEERGAMREPQAQSLIAVPVGAETPPMAVLTFVTLRPERILTERDFAFAREIARRAALPLENARLHEQMRRAFEAASLNLSQVRLITDAVPALIGYIDREYRYRFANRTYEDWFGVAPERVPGMHASELMGHEAFEKLRPYFDDALAGHMVEFEDYVPYAASARWIHATYVPDAHPEGVRGFFVLVTDITQRKRAEIEQQVLAAIGQALGESLDLQETASGIARATVPLFGDVSTIHIRAGDMIERIAVQVGDREIAEPATFGLEHGAAAARVFRTGQAELYRALDDEDLAGGAIDEGHLRAMRELRLRSAMIVPVRARGEVVASLTWGRFEARVGFDEADLAVGHEVARRAGLAIENARLYAEAQRALDELAETAQRLMEANAAKDEFLSLVSHELRTPITTILGNAEILIRRAESMPAEQRLGAIADVKMEAQRLSNIIENLLVLARLERGAEIEIEPLLLERAIARVLDVVRRETPSREFVFERPGEEAPVSANALYVEQVLRNLISNADKYSPPGRPIRIIVEKRDRSWVTSVHDEGGGIPSDETERIFDPFYRSEQTSKKAPGLGVGLTVCRRLIEIQDGQLWVESDGTSGSTFSFALPAEE